MIVIYCTDPALIEKMKISVHSYNYRGSGKRVLDLFLEKKPIKLVNSYVAFEKIGDTNKELLWKFYRNMDEEGFKNAMRFLEEPIKASGREKYHIYIETKSAIPSKKLYSQMIIPRSLSYFHLRFFNKVESKIYSKDYEEKKEYWNNQVSMFLEGVDMKRLEADTFNTIVDTLTKDPWILKRVRGTRMYNTRDDMLILALLMTIYNYDSLI